MTDDRMAPGGVVGSLVGRMGEGEVSRLARSLIDDLPTKRLLDAIPDMVMILNRQRQIVAVNAPLRTILGIDDDASIIGRRPGEAIGCIHRQEGIDGCGTSEGCGFCGAVLTIRASQESGSRVEGECRLTIDRDGMTPLDCAVVAAPLDAVGERLTLLLLRDIGSRKRREVLERVFFHDILNAIGGIQGISELLSDGGTIPAETDRQLRSMLKRLAEGLAEEIAQQRRLLEAERGEYDPRPETIDLATFLETVVALYAHHPRAPERTVRSIVRHPLTIHVDQGLLRRVVGNMILNALEATPPGAEVIVEGGASGAGVTIRVVNPGEIPRDVQLRIFQRSFSTKGETGRGIGTYSMKLFGERYLGGRVSFFCHDDVTEFSLTLPSSVTG